MAPYDERRYGEYKFPVPSRPHFVEEGECISDANLDYVYYDHKTMTYKIRSQEIENASLRQQLDRKELKRVSDLQTIISYFYKR